MKKIGLISLLALFVSVIMIGCGGNSKLDPIPPIPTNGYSLVSVTSPFDIGYAGQKKDFHVQVLKDGLPVSGETITTESLPSQYGYLDKTAVVTDDTGYATFSYTAADPLTDGVRPLALIHDDGNETFTIEYLVINIKSGQIPIDYQLVNVTTPIEIMTPGQSVVISATLVDEKNVGVPDQTITISSLPDTKFGTVTPVATKTDAGGVASFAYTAPNDLIGLTNVPLTLTFTQGGQSISATVDIVFGKSGYYRLVNATTPINISEPSQQATISIDLVNPDNVGVPGKVITISALPCTDCGVISPISTTTTTAGTGRAGRASFNYVAPDKLEGMTTIPLTLSFTEGAVTITQGVQIVFEKTGYRFINVTTPILINQGSQVAEVSANLIDEKGNGVDAEVINMTPVASGYGEFVSNTVNTDASGKAAFEYQAPLHLTDIAGTSTYTTMSYFDGIATVTANVEIKITGGHTGYQLVNAKDPYYVYSATQTDTFDIQLIKDGLPVLDARSCNFPDPTVTVDCVIPDVIDRRFGRFEGTPSSGGQNDGYLHYKYLAPSDDEKAANGEDTTFIVVYIDENGMIVAESAPISLRMRY